MKNLIILINLIFITLSCKSFRLNKEDLEWQPYKKGDILVFESNHGERDTIKIKSIEIFTNPDDPLAVVPKKVETLFVSGEYYHNPKKDIMGRMYSSTYCDVIEMGTSKMGSYIDFKFRLGDNKLKYPSVVLSIEEMNKIRKDNYERYKIEAKEYNDNMRDQPFDLRYIYWNKEYGYLVLEFKNNYIWTLKSFIRDGKEIL